MNQITTIPNQSINDKIYTIRGVQVMLDKDLAELYGVETRRLNEQVKRNVERFPKEFMFQLTKEELENWKSQFATSNKELMGLRKLPFAFTEQGVSMLSAVLKSQTAIQTSIMIIKSFVNMKRFLHNNSTLFTRIESIEKRQISYEINNDSKVNKILSLLDNSIATQGIFYNGQIFDAYAFINDILKKANKTVLLIDNYIDDSVFSIFSKYPNISFTIYTHTISKQLNLDFKTYQKQYSNIELKINKNFHDRFIIIDDKKLYHLGASLKDLGKKVFAFSKLDVDIEMFLDKGF